MEPSCPSHYKSNLEQMKSMEQHVEQSVARREQATAHWYRAATLAERLTSWSARGAARILTEESDREEAEESLRSWKAQKPFDDDSLFADRLAMNGITELDLLALLAEPLGALQERLSRPSLPDWVAELVDALSTDLAPLPVSEEDRESLSQKFLLLQPFYPLLRKSITLVQQGLEELARAYPVLPYDSQTVLSLLLPNLFQQIAPQVSKTLVLELHIARLRGHLQGETPQERFQDYLHRLSQREHRRPFLEEYCVLARHIVMSGKLWADCSLELMRRLCADWQEILAVFSPEREPGPLIQVAGGAGDRHRGGHSVMVMAFGSGWRLVYKPKSLTIDRHFQELLAWLNAHGTHPAYRLLKLIDKVTYGWTEYIETGSCSSAEEVARFYERQGGYLALLYGLEATDFHYENIIAAGEQPLLIDLEALFHPQDRGNDEVPGLAEHALERSVLRSLLLPWRVLFNEEGEGIDIGGLSRQVEGQLSPRPVAQWTEAGTDEMKLVRKRVELAAGNNSPLLNGQQVDPLDYIDVLIKGFTRTYRLLMTKRDELLTCILPRFARDEIRFVARATRTYAALLTESFHPNLLRDGLKRERFFDRLWLAVEYRPTLARLIAAERADLLRGDIPLFTARPDSLDVWTSQGEHLPAFFARSSLQSASERFQQFSEADLRRQIWLIRASFANLAGQRLSVVPIPEGNRSNPPANTLVDRERLLGEARAIGDRLYERALRDTERVDWVGLNWVMERDWQIAPAGLDLFHGLSGILLFLGYLGLITSEARYTTLAQDGLKTARTALQQYRAIPGPKGIGAFTGLGSCFVLFTHLSGLWRDSALLQEVATLLPSFVEQIEHDEHYNLVSGAAGGIVSLLNLYAVAPSDQILCAAIQCGEHLLTHAQAMPQGVGWRAKGQQAPLTGFAYGAAGIAWSLLKLAAASGRERFREAALEALVYERSLFSSQRCNWLDLRRQPAGDSSPPGPVAPAQSPKERYGLSWSYGAPGIALGRLASLPYLDDPVIHTELDVALRTTLSQGFGYVHAHIGPNHSLAYGDGGNLETVLLAAQILNTPQLHVHLQRLTASFLESMQRHGWVMGTPLNVETPGLLIGLAGIGYQCLRLAQPENVPSILTLDAPPALLR